MPHGGKGSRTKHAQEFFARQRELKEIGKAMQPADPHADGRLGAHGAGNLALLCQWRANDASDDDTDAIGVRPDPVRPDYRKREKSALGDLKCPECHKPIKTTDLDTLRDTSRNLGVALPTDRHLNCTLARAKAHRNLAKRGDLVCVKCHLPILVAELDRMQFVGRRLGRALSTDMHVDCQVSQS